MARKKHFDTSLAFCRDPTIHVGIMEKRPVQPPNVDGLLHRHTAVDVLSAKMFDH